MKKFILLITVLMFFVSTAYSLSYPRWRSLPIHVYIPPNNGNYTKMMYRAFNSWQEKSGGIIRFKYVAKANEADIFVDFTDRVNCGQESAVGCAHTAIRNGFFTQSYIEIGMKDTSFSLDKNGKFVKQTSTRSNDHLYGVMIHEIGHALGLKHTEDKNSIMFPIDLNELQYITPNDINALKKIYK